MKQDVVEHTKYNLTAIRPDGSTFLTAEYSDMEEAVESAQIVSKKFEDYEVLLEEESYRAEITIKKELMEF